MIDDLRARLSNPVWTLTHLYRIIDKQKKSIPFCPNAMQAKLFSCKAKRLVTLKARQLGSTTGWCIYMLDKALWNPNQSIGIISYSQDAARDILGNIIGHALDTLPERIKRLPHIQVKKRSAREIVFANGSSIKVDTTMRGGTLSHLLVTEYGKICARYPDKAREIQLGSMETVPANGLLVIESTAEGAAGHFYDLCKQGQERKPDSPCDWQFFFFPWWMEPGYRADPVPPDGFPQSLKTYFETLATVHDIKLTLEQRAWYFGKYVALGDLCKQEYPSTPSESFLVSSEAYWYLADIAAIKAKGQVTVVPYQPSVPVHTVWDIGYGDNTAIWFFQVLPSGAVHIVDYYEANREGLDHYVNMLRSKKYVYGKHYFPHDAKAHDFGTGLSTLQQAHALGLEATVLDRYNPTRGSFMIEVQRARQVLQRCWFDRDRCERGILCLENYRRKWNAQIGGYTMEPLHDEYSHCADAFRYLCQAVELGSRSATPARMDEERQKLRRLARSRI